MHFPQPTCALDRSALVIASQLMNLLGKPRKLNALFNSYFGDTPQNLAFRQHIRRSLKTHLGNARLLSQSARDRRDDKLEIDVGRIDVLNEYLSVVNSAMKASITKAEANADMNEINPQMFDSVMSVARVFNVPTAPNPAGSFEMGETLYGLLTFMIARQICRNPQSWPLPLRRALRHAFDRPASHFERGYPTDLVVDVVSVISHPGVFSEWRIEPSYISTQLVRKKDKAFSKACSNSKYAIVYPLEAA